MKLDFKKFGIKKDYLKKLLWKLGKHAFSVMLFLILCAVITGMILFYLLVILAQTQAHRAPAGAIKFRPDTYQKILKNWQEHDRKFQESSTTNYQNPFTKAPQPPIDSSLENDNIQ